MAYPTEKSTGTKQKSRKHHHPRTSEQKVERERQGFNNTRIHEMHLICADRHGSNVESYQLPDDDGGRSYLSHFLDHYRLYRPHKIRELIETRAPWCSDDAFAQMMEDRPYARPWPGVQLGWQFNLLDADRDRLGIRTIRAVDATVESIAAKRKQRNRDHQARKRRAAGAVSREDYEANSINRMKPWAAAGMSRAKWYRQRETARETGPSAIKSIFLITDDGVVSPSSLTSLKPWQAAGLSRATWYRRRKKGETGPSAGTGLSAPAQSGRTTVSTISCESTLSAESRHTGAQAHPLHGADVPVSAGTETWHSLGSIITAQRRTLPTDLKQAA